MLITNNRGRAITYAEFVKATKRERYSIWDLPTGTVYVSSNVILVSFPPNPWPYLDHISREFTADQAQLAWDYIASLSI